MNGTNIRAGARRAPVRVLAVACYVAGLTAAALGQQPASGKKPAPKPAANQQKTGLHATASFAPSFFFTVSPLPISKVRRYRDQ